MISDRIENIAQYLGMHAGLDRAIMEIRKLDFQALPNGRLEIQDEEVFANLMDTSLGAGGLWEAHRNYIDLQLVLENTETIAWAPLDDVRDFSGYDPARDIMQSADSQSGTPVCLKAGMFAVFFPEDAHKPGIGEGRGRKAVFKIQAYPKPVKTESLLNHRGTVALESGRLKLRRFREDDARAMFENWCSDPRVAASVTWEPHPDALFTARLLGTWVKGYERPQEYHWGIEMGGELIGDIAAITHNERQMSTEIGYCLSYDYWNRGIMTEALKLVMRFLFAEVGFNRIVLRHLVSNAASGRVMQKAGLRYEGTLRQLMKNKQGVFEDVAMYAALKDEWLAENQ